jgi:hypothetical protein
MRVLSLGPLLFTSLAIAACANGIAAPATSAPDSNATAVSDDTGSPANGATPPQKSGTPGAATPGANVSVTASTSASCDVHAYGAKGDGVTKDTAAIQAAIDDCAMKGGGDVWLQKGTFLSGMIRLKSRITFHVDGGATLKGSLDDADYPDTNPPTNNSQLSNCKKTLVYAESVSDIRITGAGTIDGGGDADKWVNTTAKEALRPMAIFIVLSQSVTIDTITVKNAAMWGVVNMETDNLAISKITVDSTHGATRDGIDVVDCHHVTIQDVTVSSEDDSICLKSGVARGVDDVTVKNAHILTSGVANALKLGTATYGPFTNITFDTIDLAHADKAAMAVESVDGAVVSNVTFKNITLHDVGTPFFLLVGDRGARPAGAAQIVGHIDGVHFENVSGDGARHDWGAIVSGLVENGVRHPVSNVTFTNVNVMVQGSFGQTPAAPPEYAGQYPDPNLWGEVPAEGLFLRHADDVTFVNSTIGGYHPDARPIFSAIDTSALAVPACDVTFVLRTDVNAPSYDPASDSFRVVGAATVAGVVATDPLGNWSAASGGVALTRTTDDPSGRYRFSGHATLPQGAPLQFKAVVGSGASVTWERAALGNRSAVVPSTAATEIDLDWQN